jgi:hypothetical protein
LILAATMCCRPAGRRASAVRDQPGGSRSVISDRDETARQLHRFFFTARLWATITIARAVALGAGK